MLILNSIAIFQRCQLSLYPVGGKFIYFIFILFFFN